MKKLIISISAFIAIISLVSCKRDYHVIETTPTDGMGNLKLINASAYTTANNSQIKVNDVRVSNTFGFLTPFPGGGINTGGSNYPLYLPLNPGSNKIAVSIPKVNTGIDSIVLFSGNLNFEANKFYSVYLADTGVKTQVVVINDNLSAVETDKSRYRFLNLMPNVPAIDLYWGTTIVAANVAYKSSSPEFSLNRGETGVFYIRPAGAAATSTAIAQYPTLANSTTTIPNQRVMTIFARGYSGTTGNRAPNISFVYNK